MIRLIILVIFLVVSLLCVFRVPYMFLWTYSVYVSENSWKLVVYILPFLLWGLIPGKFRLIGTTVGVLAILVFLVPDFEAYRVSVNMDHQFRNAFGSTPTATALHRKPFRLPDMIARRKDDPVPFSSKDYCIVDGDTLSLDYYPAQLPGKRPCVVVVHGGAWMGGYSNELPQLNWRLAGDGYNVAAVNYRLMPRYQCPAQMEDIDSAIRYLVANSEKLHIDTNALVLIGRSAGAQIALTAAYSLHEPGIKGVVGYYSPTDLAWCYNRKVVRWGWNFRWVLENYLGGPYLKVPQKYISNSPVTMNRQNLVPTLLIHGGNDAIVEPENSLLLDKSLELSGVKHITLILPWAVHCFDFSLSSPGGQLSAYATERFIDELVGSRR